MQPLKLTSNHYLEKGFTIVELLIVIVVIGVLAAISTVAYNGIQNRAQNTIKTSNISESKKALSAYYALNSHYYHPDTGASGDLKTVCLGSGYSDHTGDGVPDCRWNSGNVTVDEEYNEDLLREVGNSTSIKAGGDPICNGDACVDGTYLMYDSDATLDGEEHLWWIVYATKDNSCPVGPTPRLSDSYPNFISKSDSTPSEPWGSGGLCFTPLSH